ncbi:crossover junction endodeoxyribonuclease RuvC [uncultured Mailhella sp.]|uniref:crossover junction endodeoxyribonuclease RuvC n=1 Tax=uncultured Mailhella sp. TaxID=1981031 RepID=UPI00320AAF00
MKTYAGIDPSITNTGVVLLDERGRTLATYNSKTGCRKKDYASDILFYRSRADEIISFIRERSADGLSAAVYEDYSFDSVHRTYSLAEYGGILKMTLMTAFPNTAFHFSAPATIKKFATGTGTATKEMMRDKAVFESALIANLGAGERTFDVCDAYFMASMARYVHEELRDIIKGCQDKALLRMRLELAKKQRESWKTVIFPS